MCDKIINDADSVPTNVTNTIITNIASAVLVNSDDKKVKYKMDCYILYIVLLVIMLPLIIAIIWCHYTEKKKRIGALAI